MRTSLIIFPLLVAVAACEPTAKKTGDAPSAKPQTDTLAVQDTTPRVTGIGGIFFFCDDPGKAKEWYHQNLGLETNDYGATFEFRNGNRPDEINYLEWSPFKKGSSYFAPSKKEFMVNYRVQNLAGLVRKLKSNGVTIVDTIQTVEYGKFVHIMDAEGNKVELWEPVDHVLTKMGGKTNK